jgi:hypothetical protein
MPVLSTRGAASVKGFGLTSFSRAPYSIDFLVIGGGGGGGGNAGSGGGAGGYRTSTQTGQLDNVITITVGAGGSGTGRTGGVGPYSSGVNGDASSISGTGLTTISSAGGGRGGIGANVDCPTTGGSGGGGHQYGQNIPNAGCIPGASGNVPNTSPSQGNYGGDGVLVPGPYLKSAGGGGAGGVGGVPPAVANNVGGVGGAGSSSSITGTSITRASGGSGSSTPATPGGGGSGPGGAGTANTGGGGGGGNGNGGSGVVILSVPTNLYSGVSTGSPTVTTYDNNTVLQFNGSGSYTI